MTDKDFEAKLEGFDYSVFSKVRESLLNDILRTYDKDSELMTDEELDYVAAAGNPSVKPYRDK